MDKTKVQFDKNSKVRKGRRTKIFFVTLLLILAIIAGIIALLRKPAFQINHINVVGTQSLDPNDVLQIAEQYISGNYVLVIPRTNALFFSKSGMQNYLISKIPSLESDTVEFSDRNVLTVTVVEKKPQYLWCADATDCYFVDQNGIIYDQAPEFTPGVFITFTGTASSAETVDPNPLGERFASPAEFQFITNTLDTLQNYPMHILSVQYLLDTNTLSGGQPINEGDIAITVDQIKNTIVSPVTELIITNTETSADIISALDLLANDQDFTGTLATSASTLNYIDLRFAGKIYYKFGTVTPSAQPLSPQSATSTPVAAPTAKAKPAVKKPVVTAKKKS